jgi:5'-deoxynucleotidase YfbR-like HD superfamily hydrolase
MVTSVVELLNIDVDKARAIKLALVHNLFEVESDNTDYILIATGEVDKQAKIKLEQEQMAAIAKRFPMIGLYELFSELITNKTNEARLVNALSKIETLGHLVNCGYGVYDTPELIAVYADEAVSTYPDLLPLLGETKKRLQKEFEKGNFVWRDEYNLGL